MLYPLRNLKAKVTDLEISYCLKCLFHISQSSKIVRISITNTLEVFFLSTATDPRGHPGKGLKVKIEDTFIKSSTAFLSFKLILKLVGLTSVVLIVFILMSLCEGQHDIHFMG